MLTKSLSLILCPFELGAIAIPLDCLAKSLKITIPYPNMIAHLPNRRLALKELIKQAINRERGKLI
ncbi:hypothetical protein [Nostoc sp.]|uniref:hypothetical protein n=1 Tax=Nostoc sp. TaxID=1180 RepID=UPI002FFBDFAE